MIHSTHTSVKEIKERTLRAASISSEHPRSFRSMWIQSAEDNNGKPESDYSNSVFTLLALHVHKEIPFSNQVRVSLEYKQELASRCYAYWKSHKYLFTEDGKVNPFNSRRIDEHIEEFSESFLQDFNAIVIVKDQSLSSKFSSETTGNSPVTDENKEEFAAIFAGLGDQIAHETDVNPAIQHYILHDFVNLIFTKRVNGSSMPVDWTPNELRALIKNITSDELNHFCHLIENYLLEFDIDAGRKVIGFSMIPHFAKELLFQIERVTKIKALKPLEEELVKRIQTETLSSYDWMFLQDTFMNVFPQEYADQEVDRRSIGTRKILGFEFSDVFSNAEIMEQLVEWPFGLQNLETTVIFTDGVYAAASTLPLGTVKNSALGFISEVLYINGMFWRNYIPDAESGESIQQNNIYLFRQRYEHLFPLSDVKYWYYFTLEHEKVHAAIRVMVKRNPDFFDVAYRAIIKDRHSVFNLLGQSGYDIRDIGVKVFVEEELACLWLSMKEPSLRERIRNELPEHYNYAIEVMKA